MALPFVAGLVIGSGVALLFAKKDMVQKGLDLAKDIIKEKAEVVAPKRKRRTKTEMAEVTEAEVQKPKTTRKRRTRKPQAARANKANEANVSTEQ